MAVPQQAHQNVWIARFDVNYYKIVTSIQSEKFEFAKYGKIYEFGEETDNAEILKRKDDYFSLVHELGKTNRFSHQSKITPDALWIESCKTKLPNKSDYVFDIIYGGIVFNQSCTNILKQHRLGENILTPIQIYDLSTGELVSDEVFYFLNLYERRQYICEVQSNKELDSIPTSYGVNSFSGYITNQEVDVAKSALDCDVDLWYDPRFLGRFFMSERLHDALSEAGMIDKFKAYTCNLI